MKLIIIAVFASLGIAGCGLLNSRSKRGEGLTPTFTLADTTGAPNTTFHSGESFLMSFQLINTSPDTIKYYSVFCFPSVIFGIYRNDSLITETPWNCDNALTLDYFNPGDTLQGEWKAPKSTNGISALPPGSYVAKVVFPKLSEMNGVNPAPQIGFRITQ